MGASVLCDRQPWSRVGRQISRKLCPLPTLPESFTAISKPENILVGDDGCVKVLDFGPGTPQNLY